jgi:FG-GAP-like repeat
MPAYGPLVAGPSPAGFRAVVYDAPVRRAAVVAVIGLAAGCLRTATYECATSEQCRSGPDQGSCEPAPDGRHFCALPDPTCESQLRFTGAAPDGIATTCAGGITPQGRSHDVCLPGARFPREFSSCTEVVCAKEPTCCASSWTRLCVMEADLLCPQQCGRQLAFAGKGVVSIVADDDRDGVFTVVSSTGTASQFFGPVEWADLDGDATPELLVTTSNLAAAGDEQSVDHYDGRTIAAGFDLRTITTDASRTPWVNYSALALSVGDYDKDGYADVAWLGTFPSFLVAHNHHDGRFTLGPEPPAAPPDLVNPIVDGVGWGDVDSDGDDDLAIAFDNTVWILIADHDRLQPTWTTAIPSRPYWGAWGDVDGDGKLDLVVVGDGFGRLWRNRGAGLDPTPVWSVDGTQFYGGTWIDVDRDGDLDLALTVHTGKLQLYLNDHGVMQTTPVWSSLEDNEAPAIGAADVDGDKDLDLVIANQQPYPPRIYLNDGDQTFSLGQITLPANNYDGVAATARTAPR